mgnify:CR=1 FL=1
MVKYLTIFLLFIFMGCQKELPSNIDKYQSINKEIFFNVVQKNIIFTENAQGIYSDLIKKYINSWYENDIKVNGFDGILNVEITKISSYESIVQNGVKIEVILNLEFKISKTALNNEKIIYLNGSEFGELTGSFSLNDKAIEVENIIKRLINNFSLKLSNEIN